MSNRLTLADAIVAAAGTGHQPAELDVIDLLASSGTNLTPVTNDGASLGTAGTAFSDLFLADGGVIDFNNGDVTLTHAANKLTLTVPDLDGLQWPTIELYRDSTTPSNGDWVAEINFYGEDSVGDKQQYTSIVGTIASTTSTSEEGSLLFRVVSAGTMTSKVSITSSAMSPSTSDATALGTTAKMWSDLFLASGAVINFNNGDVTATHAANALAFAGASSGYTFDAKTKIGTYTVATLPAGVAGDMAFATDCRVFNGAGVQEGAGAGTGGLVTHNGTAWKIAGTNVTAVA